MMVMLELKPGKIGRDLAHPPFGVRERKDRSKKAQPYNASWLASGRAPSTGMYRGACGRLKKADNNR